MLKCFQDFLINILIGLSKVISSLGVSQDYIFYACIYQHSRGNLSCISTALFKVHIFSTNLDVGSFTCFYHRNDVDSWYTEYHVNFLVCYQRF